jgi:hypothetical protein
MSETLSSDLRVVEEAPEKVRWILPSRPPSAGLCLVGFGMVAAIFASVFVLMIAPVPEDFFEIQFFVLVPFLLFGLAIAGFGLWLIWSHLEVDLHQGQLRFVTRLGLLKRSRLLPVDSIRRFQIQDFSGKAARGSPPRSGILTHLAMLQAEVAKGPPVTLAFLYPRELLQRLADDLSRHCERWGEEQSAGRAAWLEQEAENVPAPRPEPTAQAAPPEQGADGLPTVPAVAPSDKPGTRLRYQLASGDQHPGCTLAFLVCFTLFWCGFISFWGYGLVQTHLKASQALKSVSGGQGFLWGQMIFFIPFAVAGVVLVGASLRQVYRTLGHTRARVEVSAQPLHPGEKFEVFVSLFGPLNVKGLRVSLVCQEEASYGEGTNVRTETRRVVAVEVLRREAFSISRAFPYEVHQVVRVPARAMHSFEAKHNKVRWLVVVAGEVAGWPNFEHTFPVVVHPAAGGQP